MTPFREWFAKRVNFYPTEPGETTRFLKTQGLLGSVWEPACGDGVMAQEIVDAGYWLMQASDLHAWGYGTPDVDFLTIDRAYTPPADTIMTNPPYDHAEAFVRRALQLARYRVVMLMRLAFLEGVGRADGLWQEHPPARVYVSPRRMTMYPGRQRREGEGSGTMAMAWYVWDVQAPTTPGETRLLWLPV